MTWREHCRPIIANVIARHGTKSSYLLKLALRHAYPYGERKYHPYKIWCDEIKQQLGTKRLSRIEKITKKYKEAMKKGIA